MTHHSGIAGKASCPFCGTCPMRRLAGDSERMGVGARPEAYTLADLALALTASAGVDAVADTAARAAARMVGDCAGVRLVQPDAGYGVLTVHHIDPERAKALVDAFGG